MRTNFTLAALALTCLTTSVSHADHYVRPAPVAVRHHAPVYRAPLHVRSAYYGGHEYYIRHGQHPVSFIRALYVDVAGRPATQFEVDLWLSRLYRVGDNRTVLAQQFIQEVCVPAPVVQTYSPAPVMPVYQQPAPVYQQPGGYRRY